MSDLKALGNAAFSAGKFAEAVDFFTQAIAADPGSHVLYSNRSAAHASLKQYEAALADADKCVALKADWPKGYSRVGAAYMGLARHGDAIAAYRKGLDIDSENEQLKAGLQDAVEAEEGGFGAQGTTVGLFGSPDMFAKLAANAGTRPLLQQPDYVAMLNELKKDPGKLSLYQRDPRIMQTLGVLLGMNVQSGDQFREEMARGGAGGGGEPESMETTSPGTQGGSAPAARVNGHGGTKPLPPGPSAAELSKAEAASHREAGNAAYKARDFAAAVAHYTTGLGVDPDDITLLTNRAAVHLETGDFGAAIADCDAAVERGRAVRADFKLIAKAMARKGTALAKQGDLESAAVWYSKALTEHRSPDTLKKLQECEKALKDAKDAAYLDPALAESHRLAGNEKFKAMMYPEAVAEYSEALRRNPNDARVYSNRAACYTKLGAPPDALKDAEKAISLDPMFTKAYTRKGAAHFLMKEYEKALEAYEKGLSIEPNDECSAGVQRCAEALNKAARGDISPEEAALRKQKAMQDPEIQGILTDPIMRQVLNDMQTDPKAAQHHMKNEGIMAKLQKLINAGIVQVR